MTQRLTLDGNVVGYWGLDEALETDNAIDATANALHLAVTASNGTAPGRVGNSRRFDGSTSYASVTSALLRLTGDLTLMAWAKLLSYNSGGSQLRCILSCGGPLTSDNTLYALNVTLGGALQYRHTSASGEVVVQTANSTIRTNQFYMIQVRRIANGGNQDVEIYVDNVLKTPALITVNGVPQSLPVPPPAANASAVFSLARSQKETNSAFWDGFIDEVSVHNVARPYHAYLIDSYYRNALRAATTKLTATNTVVAVSSYEMGAGVRWWCVERDKDLYVVKESPFGSFGPETRLTTVGGGNSSLTGAPELIYDPATDTLYVFFVSGNRIYKLTANSTDDPATINMPYTADTGGIIKSLDNVDGGRNAESGQGLRSPLASDMTLTGFFPIKLFQQDTGANAESGQGLMSPGTPEAPYSGTPNPVSLVFMTLPSLGFGLVMGPTDSEMGGYRAFRYTGQTAVLMTTPTPIPDGRYFTAISPRVYGAAYFVEALQRNGKPSGIFSAVIVDRLTEPVVNGAIPTVVSVGLDGDNMDSGEQGEGGHGQREPMLVDLTYVNRSPLKLSLQDPAIDNLGEGGHGQSGSVTNGTTGWSSKPEYSGKTVPV
jgi:hypothetical protein